MKERHSCLPASRRDLAQNVDSRKMVLTTRQSALLHQVPVCGLVWYKASCSVERPREGIAELDQQKESSNTYLRVEE